MNYILNFLSLIAPMFWVVVLIAVAFAAATLAKKVLIKTLQKFNAEEFLSKTGIKDVETKSSIDFFGKLTFIIVFLVFVPAILSKLGVYDLASPIYSIVNEFIVYIPKIVIAGIIIFVGLKISKVVRQLVTSLLIRFKVDTLQEKAGISEESTKLSSILAYIVYVIMIIAIITAALETLSISAIANPVMLMLGRVLDIIPNIFVALAILIIGICIAKAVAKLVQSIISGTGFDASVNKIFTGKLFSASKIIAESVKYIIIILFSIEAIAALNLSVLTGVGNTVLAYLPSIIGTVIIIGVALFISKWAKESILKKNVSAKITAKLVQVAIITVSVFMSLSQLQIAPAIVNAAFIIILSGIALAFALAVGLGSKEFVQEILKKAETKNNMQQVKNKIEEAGNKITDAFDK